MTQPTYNNPHSCTDDMLIEHIRKISDTHSDIASGELIAIADYVNKEIVDAGKTYLHIGLVGALLATRVAIVRYPAMLEEFEKTIRNLAKTDTLTQIEMAPAYDTLFALTLNHSYRREFEKTVRHCYLTLAGGKSYPGLGVDRDDSQSVRAGLRFLDRNRETLRILSDRYDVDKLIDSYKSCTH